MPFVISDPCIGTKDAACVDVCPVDCIHPRKDEPEFETASILYIHPEECIDCGACVPACPVAAIYDSVDSTPTSQQSLIEANAIYRPDDVDAFMRAQHFQLFDLSRYRVRRSTVDPAVATRGQLLWGHALYLRDHRRPQPAELSARLAVVAALLDLPDLAVCILDRLAVEETDKSLHMAVRRARGAICASITPRGFRRTLDQLAMMRETVAIRLFGDGPARRRGVPVWRD